MYCICSIRNTFVTTYIIYIFFFLSRGATLDNSAKNSSLYTLTQFEDIQIFFKKKFLLDRY